MIHWRLPCKQTKGWQLQPEHVVWTLWQSVVPIYRLCNRFWVRPFGSELSLWNNVGNNVPLRPSLSLWCPAFLSSPLYPLGAALIMPVAVSRPLPLSLSLSLSVSPAPHPLFMPFLTCLLLQTWSNADDGCPSRSLSLCVSLSLCLSFSLLSAGAR